MQPHRRSFVSPVGFGVPAAGLCSPPLTPQWVFMLPRPPAPTSLHHALPPQGHGDSQGAQRHRNAKTFLNAQSSPTFLGTVGGVCWHFSFWKANIPSFKCLLVNLDWSSLGDKRHKSANWPPCWTLCSQYLPKKCRLNILAKEWKSVFLELRYVGRGHKTVRPLGGLELRVMAQTWHSAQCPLWHHEKAALQQCVSVRLCLSSWQQDTKSVNTVIKEQKMLGLNKVAGCWIAAPPHAHVLMCSSSPSGNTHSGCLLESARRHTVTKPPKKWVVCWASRTHWQMICSLERVEESREAKMWAGEGIQTESLQDH